VGWSGLEACSGNTVTAIAAPPQRARKDRRVEFENTLFSMRSLMPLSVKPLHPYIQVFSIRITLSIRHHSTRPVWSGRGTPLPYRLSALIISSTTRRLEETTVEVGELAVIGTGKAFQHGILPAANLALQIQDQVRAGPGQVSCFGRVTPEIK